MLKGPSQCTGYAASLLYHWMANYSIGGKKKEKKRGKTKTERTGLFLCPHHSAGILCLGFLLFSITKGSFQCCQLNWSVCVLHPIPTYHSLSLPLSFSTALRSSSFSAFSLLNIASVEVFLPSPHGSRFESRRNISDNSCIAFKTVKMLLGWTRPVTHNYRKLP